MFGHKRSLLIHLPECHSSILKHGFLHLKKFPIPSSPERSRLTVMPYLLNLKLSDHQCVPLSTLLSTLLKLTPAETLPKVGKELKLSIVSDLFHN